MGKPLDAVHNKSVILGFMDKETRRSTIQYHGQEERELVKQILLFVNGIAAPPTVTNGGPTPMQLGSMAQPEAESPPQGPEQPAEDPSWQNWDWGNEEDQWNGDDSI